ncbi:MAG: hypothetical protein MUD01_14100 [Chloroflexaceae bacterium]|jgi:hypothetical protein|nr:hypothetical protein [Chloroflexaceae bacterium]
MSHLIIRFGAATMRYWRETSGPQRTLFIAGTLLFVSMFFHGLLLLLGNGPLHGPVSFRKAMTFAESLGLLCWALGWALPFFRLRRWGQWAVAGYVALFGLGEAFLMSMQVWRGVPSHYNFTTPFDEFVFSLTGQGAALFALLTLLLLLWPMHREVPPSIKLALRAGLLLTMVGNGVGILMGMNNSGVWQGLGQLQYMLTNSREGYSSVDPQLGGNLVVLHAMGVHGLQLVPLVAWLLGYSHLSEGRRVLFTSAVTLGVATIFAILALHAARQLPLSTLELPALAGLVLAGGATLAGYTAAVGLAWRGLATSGDASQVPGVYRQFPRQTLS